MSKLVNDIRRCILALCFFGLVLSLIGTQLPWVQINQSTPQNPLYIIDSKSCNQTKSGPTVTSLTFTSDVFFSLTTAQLCQTFISGKLPSYIGGASLKDIRMCTDSGYNQMSNFMQDTKPWQSYSSDCNSAGSATCVLIVIALLIVAVTMLINTFPTTVQKCCHDQNSFKNKFIRSLIAFFAPASVTLGLIIYSSSCLKGDIGDVLTKRKMTRTGATGYWLCCGSCAMLWVYWLLFVYRMCDNEGAIDGREMRTKFLRKGTDVDDGMIDESQENRETMMDHGNGGGAYDEYREQRDDDSNNDGNNIQNPYDQTRKISAYEDDEIRGPPTHAPSAGSWRDVEED